MKHEIKIGSPVCFLYAQHMQRGTAKRVNKKTISVSYEIWGWNDQKGKGEPVERVKLVTKDRVVHADDEFTVVWEVDIGVEGRYYITYDEFPNENGPAHKWHQPFTYFRK